MGMARQAHKTFVKNMTSKARAISYVNVGGVPATWLPTHRPLLADPNDSAVVATELRSGVHKLPRRSLADSSAEAIDHRELGTLQ